MTIAGLQQLRASRIRRLGRVLALGLAFVWPPRRGLCLLLRVPATAARHAVNGLRLFCLEIEAQRREIEAPRNEIEVSRREIPLPSVPIDNGYIVVAPPFTPNSAGVCCMYRLCDELNGRGFPTHIADRTRTTADPVAPFVPWEHAIAMCRQGFTAVYPETVAGNPLQARNVARWVMYRPDCLATTPSTLIVL
jgi:hypothetical protein